MVYSDNTNATCNTIIHIGGSTSDHIISSKDANVLKMECGDFSSLLLPRQELEFSGIIGEGKSRNKLLLNTVL